MVSEEDFKAEKLAEWGFDKKEYTLGKIDIKLEHIWIEAKQKDEDIFVMLSQIIFTAYREKLKSQDLPIAFGCFNSKKAALIDNYQAEEVFAHTDIDWTQTPSKVNEKTVERIKFLLKQVKEYNLDDFGREIKKINTLGFLEQKQITKNNFITVYNEWLLYVGNFLEEEYRSECYIADLMHNGKKTISEKLRIVLKTEDENFYYKFKKDEEWFKDIKIKDQQKYRNFWEKYKRPPIEEYQEYILGRRDLLQPFNVREVKGAFFTPQVWAEKSKEYFELAFGENWQDEYYIWDCACGTGNLEVGLVNQSRVFMSTLDKEDLLIMKELKIMPDSTHFQFDFLNDEFKPITQGGKIPDTLWNIIKNEPQKLIIYINPPYLEVTNAKESIGKGEARTGATTNFVKSQMIEKNLGKESNELFMQFYYRIYNEIKDCKIGSFSTLKNCCAPNFENWREIFKAKFCGGFLCRANTFDNVNGKFPISFQIWDCTEKKDFKKTLKFDVFDNFGVVESKKKVLVFKKGQFINDWLKCNNKKAEPTLAYIRKSGSDFQNQRYNAIYQNQPEHHNKITKYNIKQALIYNAVRLAPQSTWLNNRDQFTKPSSKRVKIEVEGLKTYKDVYDYEEDEGFIGDCIAFALFEKNYTNWQIFANSEVGLTGVSRDMTIYDLLIKNRQFDEEATAVLEAAKKIYKLYYANFSDYNAGWNDVCKAFKGDKISEFDALWQEFQNAKEDLADHLVPFIYKYGFLQ